MHYFSILKTWEQFFERALIKSIVKGYDLIAFILTIN